jgi:hypothetical protein
MADSRRTSNLPDQALSTSPALAQLLLAEAVLDALKMILIDTSAQPHRTIPGDADPRMGRAARS